MNPSSSPNQQSPNSNMDILLGTLPSSDTTSTKTEFSNKDSSNLANQHEQDPPSQLFGQIDSNQQSAGVKTILDRGWLDSYIQYLTEAEQGKERDLQSVCHDHYSDLVDTTGMILKTGKEANDQISQLTRWNEDLLGNMKSLITASEDECKQQEIRVNLAITIHVLQQFRQVLLQMREVITSLYDGQFSVAQSFLSTVQEKIAPLESFHIYSDLERVLAKLYGQVKEGQKAGFSHWIRGCDDLSGELGLQALHAGGVQFYQKERSFAEMQYLAQNTVYPCASSFQPAYQLRLSEWEVILGLSIPTGGFSFTSVHSFFVSPTKEKQQKLNRLDRQWKQVDLATLHEIVDGFERLNASGEQLKLYSDRLYSFMKTLTVQLKDTKQKPTIGDLRDLASQCIGIVKLQSVIGFSSGQHLSGGDLKGQMQTCLNDIVDIVRVLQNEYMGKLDNYVSVSLKTISGDVVNVTSTGIELATMLNIQLQAIINAFKQLPYIEVKMLESYSVEGMSSLLRAIDQVTTKTLMDAILSDSLQSLTVESYSEFQKLLVRTGLYSASLPMPSQFPQVVAFSESVPVVQKVLLRRLGAILVYCKPAPEEYTKPLLDFVSGLLVRSVNQTYKQLLSQPSTSIANAVQCFQNLGVLSESCDFLHALIVGLTAPGTTVPDPFSAKQGLKGTLTISAQMIQRLLVSRIDDLGLGYRGMIWSCTNITTTTSDTTQDILALLRATFTCFVLLPTDLKKKLHKAALDHVSSYIFNVMETVQVITPAAIYNILSDVAALMNFATELGKHGVGNSLLQLKETCDLLVEGVAPLFDPAARAERFAHVNQLGLEKIMERYNPLPPVKCPPELKVLSRKSMEFYIKQLSDMRGKDIV